MISLAKINHPKIIIFFTLFFFLGWFFSFFNLHPKVTYGIYFLSFVLVIVIQKTGLRYIDKWLYLSMLTVIPSAFIGIFLGWEIIDILADISRYIAPILGFSAANILLRKFDYESLLNIIFAIFGYQLILYYYSLSLKIAHVISGGLIIEYAKNGLEVMTLWSLVAYFFISNKIVKGFMKILLVGYFLGFILNPILIMSKARLLAVILAIGIIFLFYSRLKTKLILSGFIIITLFFLAINDNQVFARLYSTIDLIKLQIYDIDPSTSYRFAEIYNILSMLFDKPYSIFFGYGSGAVFFDYHFPIEGGIDPANYRENGGLHDIFFGPLVYLFRYGLLGFLFISYFIKSNFSRLSSSNNDALQNSLSASFKIFIIISVFADLFVPVHLYGSFEFGMYISIALLLQKKFVQEKGNYLTKC